MKPYETFGVVVRTLGLLMVFGTLVPIAIGLLSLVGGGVVASSALAPVGFVILLVGLWLLRGAPAIVLFAYSQVSREQTS